nr:reverse transcriptase domain-containing protein [Tanacetum cinerariifolium]
MTHLLEKEIMFNLSKECIKSFNILKKKLTEAPILVAPDWELPFEIMCDASDYTVENPRQDELEKKEITETFPLETLGMIAFRGDSENLTADHLSRLENPRQDELEKKEITKTFPLKTLGMIAFRGDSGTSWFANIANYHARNFIVKGMSSQQKKKFFKDVKH